MVKKEVDIRSFLNDDFSFNLSVIDGELSISFKTLRINFESYLIFKLGYPNDEVYMFDDFFSLNDLESMVLYQVSDSEWIKEIKEANTVHPRNNLKMFNDEKHYRIYFEDEVFECIAKAYFINS